MLKLLRKIFNIKPKPCCPSCKSKNMEHTWSLTRGWNNLCNQAIGAPGNRCYDCGFIIWDQSLEDYRKGLPEWCTAWEDRTIKDCQSNIKTAC